MSVGWLTWGEKLCLGLHPGQGSLTPTAFGRFLARYEARAIITLT